MRRSKRRFRRMAGPRPDWVFRDDLYDDTGALFEQAGTYSSLVITLTNGPNNAVVKWLYDSSNYIARVVNVNALPAMVSSSSRAEGGKPFIHWVQGQVMFRPTTWAVGSVSCLAFRFGIFEQDASSGAALLDPTYTMFVRTNNVQQNPAMWANTRTWQHERRWLMSFSDNTNQWMLRFSFPVKRRLRPHEGYGLYIEGSDGNGPVSSVNHQIGGLYFRTLVSDEG